MLLHGHACYSDIKAQHLMCCATVYISPRAGNRRLGIEQVLQQLLNQVPAPRL